MRTEKKPVIVFSSYDDLENPYYAGGGARAIHEIARRLLKDYQVTVLTGAFPGCKDEVTHEGVTYIRIGHARWGAQLGQLAFSLLLPLYAKRLQFDLWIESFTPPFSVSLLPLVTTKPVIGLVHMLAAKDMERKYHLPFGIIESMGLTWYRTFITIGPQCKKTIAAINPRAHIEQVPNGVALPHPKRTKAAAHHILFMGRIEYDQKGLDLLLEAYASVRDQIAYPLVIAGDGTRQQVGLLERRIKQLGIASHVHLAGRVAGAEKDRLFRESVAVVCPSRYETYPLAALEALAYKKCLISFDIEGMSWIPRSCQIKVPQYDSHAFGEKLVFATSNQQKTARMTQRGYAFVKNLTWDAAADKYRELIVETLGAAAALPRWQFLRRSI